MPGYAICPYCKATVQPQEGADGRKVCPVCRNTGKSQPVPPAAGAPATAPATAWSAPTPAPVLPTAPGAMASLICGIIGIVTSGFVLPGIVLGIIAILQGGKARKAMADEPGKFQGAGLATAGRVCGIVAIVLSLLSGLFTAGLILLVANLESDQPAEFDVLRSDGPGGVIYVSSVSDESLLWSDLDIEGGDCEVPSGEVRSGDTMACQQDGEVVIRHHGEVLFRGDL